MDTGFVVAGRPPSQNENGYQAVRGSLGMFSMVQVLMGVIFSGACEKYPDLQFVMGECGAGWVPFALDRMDHIYDDAQYEKKFDPPFTLKPSEYWYQAGLYDLPGRVRRQQHRPPGGIRQPDVGF